MVRHKHSQLDLFAEDGIADELPSKPIVRKRMSVESTTPAGGCWARIEFCEVPLVCAGGVRHRGDHRAGWTDQDGAHQVHWNDEASENRP